MDEASKKQSSVREFMKKIAFPFTLLNIIISAALFFMSTGIALTNTSFKSYVIFLVFLALYYAIMIALYLNNIIIMHTMFFSAVLYIFFYNFIPYIYLKNSAQLITSNYIIIISCFLSVFSAFVYFIGYNTLFNSCLKPPPTPELKLPDCDMLMVILKSNGDSENYSGIVLKNLILTLFLSFIGAFVADSIVLGCFGSSYFPNYLLFTNQDMCSRPTNQSFKCSMYQNGKIITATL